MSQSSRWRTRGLAILAGLLFALAFPPFGLVAGFGAFVALVPMLIALEDTKRLRDAFSIGYLMMFVASLIATYWVGGWRGEGSVDPFLMIGGVALALVHPIFLVVPVLVYDAFRRRFGRIAALVALPVIWIGFEYWHSTGDLSFPWLSLYNTQTYNTAFIQFIEFTGSYGLSLVILLVNILVYLLLRQRQFVSPPVGEALKVSGFRGGVRKWIVAAIVMLIVLPYSYGLMVLAEGSLPIDNTTQRSITVTIVQPNINPWDKWSTGIEAVTDSMFRSTRTAIRAAGTEKPDLVLWPETAITYPVTLKWTQNQLSNVYGFVSSIGAAVLTGIPDREEYINGVDAIPRDAKKSKDPMLFYRDWNSSMLFYIGLDGRPTYERYHKQKLVPFGEHVPFVDWFPILGDWFQWGVGLGSWNSGEGYDVLRLPLSRAGRTAPDTAKLCTMICYESVYPSYVRKFVANGAEVIGIITNDGWYGKSSGPYQHNRYAILRAVENRRWVIRSANTGISSVIDDKGHILEDRPLFTSTSITRRILLDGQQTLYTQLGDYIAVPCEWALAAMIVLLVGMRFASHKNRRES
ncbi:MAG: apolipoprotein N-acyltransferase [Bacteroidetes bacterium]|nr:apolipoprotein N-acyltransferase [Bacteroidota bacterium]